MELHQLRSLAMVAREGSIARAAERLFSSQPAVSAHIKALEDELGLLLFERSPQGMRLTSAGEALWEDAERVLDATRLMSARADELKTRVAGRLRLGLNNEAETIRAPALLADLAAAHPQLGFDLVYGSSGAIVQALLAREIDAGYFEGPVEHDAIAATTVRQREMVVVYPLEWDDRLRAADFAGLAAHPWVFVSPQCSHYRLLHRLMTEQRVTLEPRFHVDEDNNALRLVANRLGISLAASDYLAQHPLRDQLAVWPHFRRPLALNFGHLASRAREPMIRHTAEAVARIWAPSPA